MTRLSELKKSDEAYIKVQFYQDTEDGTDMSIRIKFIDDERKLWAWLWSPDLPIKVDEMEDVKPKIKVPKEIGEIIDNNTLKDLVEATCYGANEVWRWLYDSYENNVNDDAEGVMVLAELKINGFEIEELMGVILIDVHDNQLGNFYYVKKSSNSAYSLGMCNSVESLLNDEDTLQITKSEAEREFPNFRWISLDELESEN